MIEYRRCEAWLTQCERSLKRVKKRLATKKDDARVLRELAEHQAIRQEDSQEDSDEQQKLLQCCQRLENMHRFHTLRVEVAHNGLNDCRKEITDYIFQRCGQSIPPAEDFMAPPSEDSFSSNGSNSDEARARKRNRQEFARQPREAARIARLELEEQV